jgi:hypothetical protein
MLVLFALRNLSTNIGMSSSGNFRVNLHLGKLSLLATGIRTEEHKEIMEKYASTCKVQHPDVIPLSGTEISHQHCVA